MTRLLLLVMASGCATAAQSARTVGVGKVQVTLAGTRNTTNTSQTPGVASNASSPPEEGTALYGGELMVRTGLADRVDVGLSVTRNPGSLDNVWAFAVDPKVRFTPSEMQTTVSLGLPLGAILENQPVLDDSAPKYIGMIAVPTLYVSQMLSPTLELIAAPKVYVVKASEGYFVDTKVHTYFGGSIGLRISDPQHYWAIQPEIGVSRVSAADGDDGFDATTILTLGLGISVGN